MARVKCTKCSKWNDGVEVPSIGKYRGIGSGWGGVPTIEQLARFVEQFDLHNCKHCDANLFEQKLVKLQNYTPWIVRQLGWVVVLAFPVILGWSLSKMLGFPDGIMIGITIPSTVLFWWKLGKQSVN